MFQGTKIRRDSTSRSPLPSSFTYLPPSRPAASFLLSLIDLSHLLPNESDGTPPCLWTCTLPQLYETRSLLAHSSLPKNYLPDLTYCSLTGYLQQLPPGPKKKTCTEPRNPLSSTSQFRTSEWQRPRPLRRCRRWGDRTRPCFFSHG